MTRPGRRVAVIVGGVVVAGAAIWGANAYRSRRAEIESEISRYRTGLDNRDQEIAAGELRVRKQLTEFGATTLGGTSEQVEASLRTAMNQIVENVGLSRTKVNTGAADPQRNPAAGLVREISSKDARSRPDFVVISATVSGVGSYEQAVRLVALLRQQPYVHRIDEISLRPSGPKKELVEVSVGFSTAFSADLARKPEADKPLWESGRPDTLTLVRDLASRDPFRPPAESPPGERGTAAAPPASAAMPPDWQVTAIMTGVSGPEVWLSDSRSGQRAVLTPKSAIAGVELVSIESDTATVRAEGKLFVIRLGRSLSDRESAIR